MMILEMDIQQGDEENNNTLGNLVYHMHSVHCRSTYTKNQPGPRQLQGRRAQHWSAI